jgi:hypothetical protein
MLRRVALVRTDISEESIAYIVKVTRVWKVLQAGFIFDTFFDLEDRRNIFLRKIG